MRTLTNKQLIEGCLTAYRNGKLGFQRKQEDIVPGTEGRCLYRYPGGYGCAIGVNLTDAELLDAARKISERGLELYENDEHMSWAMKNEDELHSPAKTTIGLTSSELQYYGAVKFEDDEVACELQNLHDNIITGAPHLGEDLSRVERMDKFYDFIKLPREERKYVW